MKRSSQFVALLASIAFLLIVFLRSENAQSFAPDPVSSREMTRALPIRQISILGERNSGTRWTYE